MKNDVGSARLKHTGSSATFLNEATLGYQKFRWNPVPEDSSLVGQNYFGLMRIGSKETIQDISQSRYSVRDDLTVTSLQWAGDHTLKTGVTFDYLNYDVVKRQNGVPVFNFRPATFNVTPGDMPFEAFYGFGNPDLSTNNKQFGVYVQDDWRITPRLTANIGLRWDFETDMLNNDYVTPANVRAGLSSVYPSNYFTDGTQRDTYYGAIAPRIGLSYDVTGQGKTIAYAGWGRYYDRTLYNDILDEKFRLQWPTYHFFFSKDGSPQDGNPAIKWDPKYLSQSGLDALIASGTAPAPEIYLLDNDTKPPSSDQWSAGLRHNFGPFVASVGYMNVKSKNQLTWTCGIKDPTNGNCDFGARPAAAQGLGFSLLSRAKSSWFESVQVAFDKPYTSSSHWQGTLSYVYSRGRADGQRPLQLRQPRPGLRDPAAEPERPEARDHGLGRRRPALGIPFRDAHHARVGVPLLRQRLLDGLLDVRREHRRRRSAQVDRERRPAPREELHLRRLVFGRPHRRGHQRLQLLERAGLRRLHHDAAGREHELRQAEQRLQPAPRAVRRALRVLTM